MILRAETGQEWMIRARAVWHSRIIEVHVDAERIYVSPWPVSERGRYQMHEFRKTDGDLLHSVPESPKS